MSRLLKTSASLLASLLVLACLPGGVMAQMQLNPVPQAPTQSVQQPAVRPNAPAGAQPQLNGQPRPPARTPATPPAAPADPRANSNPPLDVAPSAQDETVIAPPKQKIANPTAVFSGLDKVTGRIIVFDVAIDETVQFGALQVTPRVCYTRPATEAPQTTAFVEVNEVTLQGETRKLFTGWMFAASPGLSGVEHAVYDVWLVDCKQTAPVIPGQPKR